MPIDADRMPVIVGVGEVKDRPADPLDGQEPATLATRALRLAEADAGAALLHRLDSLDVVGVVSWPYDDLPGLLADAVGATPARLQHGPIGGHTPVRFIHEAAQRIARGESTVAAICGAESSHTAAMAARRNHVLPWSQPAGGYQGNTKGWLPARNRDYLHPLARRHGITEPITVYPLYEGATAASWGQTPAEAAAESAAVWAGLSRVAAANPNAWLQQARTEADIATVSAANRIIAWPYPKLMVANPAVNQGAAVLLTSLATARAAGIAEEQLVHVHGGAAAAEPMDWTQRDSFVHAAGQEVVLGAMLQDLAGDAGRLRAVELYNCFPVVPKLASRQLGLPPGSPVTVAGGMTFHGAPLNNYMTHAAAACVRALRVSVGVGLLYGQGGYLTWHHALLLGREPATLDVILRPFDLQAMADQRRSPPPVIAEEASGQAMLEAFTIPFRPDGQPDFGFTVLRLPGGSRTLARVPATDGDTLAALMSAETSPIGMPGTVQASDGLLTWRAR